MNDDFSVGVYLRSSPVQIVGAAWKETKEFFTPSART